MVRVTPSTCLVAWLGQPRMIYACSADNCAVTQIRVMPSTLTCSHCCRMAAILRHASSLSSSSSPCSSSTSGAARGNASRIGNLVRAHASFIMSTLNLTYFGGGSLLFRCLGRGIAETHNQSASPDCVVSVPCWFTDAQVRVQLAEFPDVGKLFHADGRVAREACDAEYCASLIKVFAMMHRV